MATSGGEQPINRLLQLVGSRVIRGPDWDWGKQDGGEGHAGTIHHFERSDVVVVLWDNGYAAKYRCSSANDLRILDNSPTGHTHIGSVCWGCKVGPITGIRWKCNLCDSVDLCSWCYHTDKHSLRHSFSRFFLPHCNSVPVDPRKKSKKIPLKGLFNGARVFRGLDWRWENQDGGDGKRGKIIKIQDWSGESFKSAAEVLWDTGFKNIYRLGVDGRVDLKAISEGRAGNVYKDHLPVIVNDHFNGSTASIFKLGDKVKLGLNLDIIKILQEGHGGWTDSMEESVNNAGTVHGIDQDQDIIVQYSSGNCWTFNPIVLTKITESTEVSIEAPETVFNVGDTIQICDCMTSLRMLHQEFRTWDDRALISIRGGIGRVVEVLPTGYLSVHLQGDLHNLNPSACRRINRSPSASAQRNNNGSSKDKSFSLLLKRFFDSHISVNTTEEFVKAAGSGNKAYIEELIEHGEVNVNCRFKGYEAIHVACLNNHFETVETLIKHGADCSVPDDHQNLPIHHAASGNAFEIIALLSQNGVDLNARNGKYQSALHLAVVKGHVNCVIQLLSLDCHPSLQDSEGDTPLHDAISKSREDIIKIFLENRPDLILKNNNGSNCLHHTVLKGNIEVVSLIAAKLKHTWQINDKRDDGYSALALAVSCNNTDIVEILLTNSANLNICLSNKQNILHIAVIKKLGRMVKFLVEAGVQVDKQDADGNTPLHLIMRQLNLYSNSLTNVQQIESLLEDMEGETSRSRISLLMACYLCSRGADTTLKNKLQETPFQCCLSDNIKKTVSHFCSDPPARADAPDEKPSLECMVCSDKERSVMFEPCHHVVSCTGCAVRVKKCVHCKLPVTKQTQLSECQLCSESLSSVKFMPCEHIVACSECATLMKKCLECRVVIVEKVALDFAAPASESLVSSPVDELAQLQQQLDDMREQTSCPVCLDRRKNLVFTCGHGICQMCGDKVQECPMCRRPITQRIVLY